MTEPSQPTPPRDRAVQPDHRGVEAVLGDGQAWTLPYCRRWHGLDDARDTIATALWTGGKVHGGLVEIAAMVLISRAYQLDEMELARLVSATEDKKALLQAVAEALVLPDDDDATMPRTHSQWLESGLIANGLGASNIPEDLLPFVVKHLVDTGRMARPENFISAAIGLRVRQEALASITEGR